MLITEEEVSLACAHTNDNKTTQRVSNSVTTRSTIYEQTITQNLEPEGQSRMAAKVIIAISDNIV